MKPYNDYNTYLKSKYGQKVYRIGLDAGFTCPNRDGTKGSGGCIYCDAEGSRSPYAKANIPVSEQLASRIAFLKEKYQASKFIAYFQAFTSTYAPKDKLKKIYDEVLPFKGIVGISIGTRPDAVDLDKLALIASYKNDYEVWVEYGLQSSHDRTLSAINRGHTYADFLHAVKLTKKLRIPVSAHVILGLPGESRADMINTAKKLSELEIEGLKIHVLHILKGSDLEDMYKAGSIKLLEQDEYADLVCDFLENIPKNTVIQRLTAQGTKEHHVAPEWALDKLGTIKKIEDTFAKRGTYQGINLK
ncbi:MAG: TIGR01212 family radical SAM protein [Candidatus Omnitrophota bacterium]